ncbi:uncharacterized protein METZ01_LOCUS247639, partial [marine metagenome]
AVYMAQDKGATVYTAGVSLANDETITNATDGTVLINGTVSGGTGSAAGVFQSNGDHDLTLQTGNSTTGTISITDGANGNIAITPNGSGAVQLDGLSWPTADGSANQLLTTDGSGALSWASNSAATTIDGLSDAKSGGANFTGSLIIGHQTTGTLNAADNNVAVGTTALDAITSGDQNTAIGYDALTANTTGSFNTAVGYKSLESNIGGNRNTASGFQSLHANTSGHYNTGTGMYSLYANISGDYNTAYGYESLKLNTGSNNTAFGYESGDVITSGSNNTIIGDGSDPSANNATNQTVLGQGATGQADNSVTLGNADVTAVYMAQDKGATVYAASVAAGGGSAAGVFKSDGDYDVTLQTGNSTTGSITITDGANGDITVAPNGTGKTDFNDNAITGYGADLQTESGTSKTLAAADNGTIIVCSSSSAVTITVPASLPSGFNCMIIQSGSGQVS